VSLYPPQTYHKVAWEQIHSIVVRSKWPPAWATARPEIELTPVKWQ